MCTHEFGAYTGDDKVVLSDEDREMVATLVDRSAEIQGAYNKCTDEEIKEKLAMERHTTRRSFDQLVFCSSGDKEGWNDSSPLSPPSRRLCPVARPCHSACTHWCSLPSARKCRQGPACPCAKDALFIPQIAPSRCNGELSHLPGGDS